MVSEPRKKLNFGVTSNSCYTVCVTLAPTIPNYCLKKIIFVNKLRNGSFTHDSAIGGGVFIIYGKRVSERGKQ